MEVELIDKMGSDLTVVNAARVSFGKNKEMFEASDESAESEFSYFWKRYVISG